MKNLIIGLAASLILISINYGCSNADGASITKTDVSKGEDKDTQDALMYLGFGNSKGVNNSNKERIFKEYGLTFYTGAEMDSLISKNEFIISSSFSFIGDIPANQGERIKKGYRKLAGGKETMYYLDRGNWWPLGFAGSRDAGVYVAAPKEYFTPDAIITKTDPIVMVRVDYGWIELARWDK